MNGPEALAVIASSEEKRQEDAATFRPRLGGLWPRAVAVLALQGVTDQRAYEETHKQGVDYARRADEGQKGDGEVIEDSSQRRRSSRVGRQGEL